MSKELAKYFDYKSYFKSSGINFKESGKDISRRYVGIYECPYCGKTDYHFGLNKHFKNVNCWVCGRGGSIYSYIMRIEKCSFEKAKEIVFKFSSAGSYVEFKEPERQNYCTIPRCASNKDLKILSKYLKTRKITKRNKFISKYELLFDKHSMEFYIPFYLKGELVTYKKRKITEKEYVNCPIEESALDPKTTLFNIDRVKNGGKMMVTEGFFDSSRFGDGGVDTSGTLFTPEHILQIVEKNPDTVFVCYDKDEKAQKKAEKLCNKLSTIGIKNVENIVLKKYDDIGEMPEEKIYDMREKLGFNKG